MLEEKEMVASTSRSKNAFDCRSTRSSKLINVISYIFKRATFVRAMSAMQCEVDGDGEGIIGAVEDVRQCQIPHQKTLHMT